MQSIDIFQLIQAALLIYLPAMVANMAPVFADTYKVLLWLNKPVDFGLSFGGVRLLGSHKTFRGYIAGTVMGGVTAVILFFLVHVAPYESFVHACVFGCVTGFAALLGDSVKSFFKRRFSIPSGSRWIPFDQIDFVVGATLGAMLFVRVPIIVATCAIVSVGFASYIVSSVGVALHMKKNL